MMYIIIFQEDMIYFSISVLNKLNEKTVYLYLYWDESVERDKMKVTLGLSQLF